MQLDVQQALADLLERAAAAQLSWSELAEEILRREQSVGQHRPDADRARRCGFGEVIFGGGKSSDDIERIAQRLVSLGQEEVLATRVDADAAKRVAAKFPFARYDEAGRTLRLSSVRQPKSELADSKFYETCLQSDAGPLPYPGNQVSVVTAGSTDMPVAREAVETLHWMQVEATLTTDVGVAGPYRLLSHLGHLRQSAAVVVIAGMEGALASVVGGLVPCPVIAVPTSVGYGSNFEGITTLLSMMSSCAAGVTVVNIDAGFKGAYVAGLIAAQLSRSRLTKLD